jgi:hypothetical protein
MMINVPRFGTGLSPIFEGNPIKQSNVSGRLDIASENVQKSEANIKQTVEQKNVEAANDAKELKSFVNVKA